VSALGPGFADPVTGAQACFRALLDAMARPGTLREAGAGLTPPAPLDPATAAVLLTLVDADTPLWLSDATEATWPWLAFHCGAVRSGDLGEATFACALTMPPLAALSPGSDAEPESSATLILQVAELGAGSAYTLSGPGLAGPARLAVTGLPEDFPAQWLANRALHPRGVDLILCAGERLAALPRSNRVEGG
jgi:alpha-D-ribose 1-methylphosphonate 5-triphosphate synthase subunit PhnH